MNTETECRELVQAYFHYVDHRDFDALLGTFTEDASFELAGQVHRGLDTIRAGLAQRPHGLITRHLQTTTRFLAVGADTAEAVSTVLVYRQHEGGEVTTEVLDFRDSFRRTSDGWRYASRVVSRPFA